MWSCLREVFSCGNHKKSEEFTNVLYAFDFDKTILEKDATDVVASTFVKSRPPDLVLQASDGGNWTECYQGLFDHMILRNGVTLHEIINVLKQLELLQGTEYNDFFNHEVNAHIPVGMDHLLHRIQDEIKKNPKSHFIVISGSNDYFIQTVLSNLDPPIIPQAIIANSAERSDEFVRPRLIFKAYEDQYTCKKCTRNICKGGALLKYVEEHGPFGRIYYAGDGSNDVCPATKLKSTDVLFVRNDNALQRILAKGYFIDSMIDIKAQVLFFETGEDIETQMKF